MILKNNNSYTPLSNGTIVNKLEKGIYELNQDSNQNFILSKQMDRFLLPEKIYGIKKDNIDRIIKYYNTTDSNLGVLLNGLKGTGKTFISKIISNKLNIPTVTINKSFGIYNEDIISFLSLFKQDLIIILDEFEKTFEDDSFILKLMDGLYNNEYKKLFILTTNSYDNIDVNLINRPSRIRYKIDFSNLDEDTIIEILEDRLEDKSNINKVIDICNTFSLLSIDILNSLIDEINLFGVDSNLSILNISKSLFKNVYVEIETCEELHEIKNSDKEIIKNLNNVNKFNSRDIIEYLKENGICNKYNVDTYTEYDNTSASNHKVGNKIQGYEIIDINDDLYTCVDRDLFDYVIYFKLIESTKSTRDYITKR